MHATSAGLVDPNNVQEKNCLECVTATKCALFIHPFKLY